MTKDTMKKITIGILIPIFISIIGWATWTTKNVFSAQKTEVVLENHKGEAAKEQLYVRDQFKSLNDKIDTNQNSNVEILLDIKQQIGALSK